MLSVLTFEGFIQIVQIFANPVDIILPNPEMDRGCVLHCDLTVGLGQRGAASHSIFEAQFMFLNLVEPEKAEAKNVKTT